MMQKSVWYQCEQGTMKPQVLGKLGDLVMYIMTLGVVHPNTATLLQDLVSSNGKTVCDFKQASVHTQGFDLVWLAIQRRDVAAVSQRLEGEGEEVELSRMLLAEDCKQLDTERWKHKTAPCGAALNNGGLLRRSSRLAATDMTQSPPAVCRGLQPLPSHTTPLRTSALLTVRRLVLMKGCTL